MKTEDVMFVDAAPGLEDARVFTAEERRMLDRINDRVASGQSLEAVMDFVFESGRSLFPCDRIGLALIEEDSRRVVSRWARALYEPIVLGVGYTQDLRGSTLEGLLQGRRLRILNDLPAYLERHPRSESTALIVREGVRASLTCPLTVDDRAVGFLFRSSRRPHVYTERELALHRAMGNRLSQAVEKAVRMAEWEAATRAYAEMMGFVSHELKSPVASMIMEADLIAGGLLGEVNDKQRQHLERVKKRGRQLLGLIGDYLDLARVEGAELRVNRVPDVPVDQALVEPALAGAETQIAEQGMRVEKAIEPPGLSVACDPALMRIVTANLVGNAVKYGEPKGWMRIAARIEERSFVLRVRNAGPGFPPSAKSALFKRFSRLDKPALKKRPGSGVGLYTCWRIVQAHGGHITAESEEGAWAEFVVRLPT